jgi:transposase InsO family protein
MDFISPFPPTKVSVEELVKLCFPQLQQHQNAGFTAKINIQFTGQQINNQGFLVFTIVLVIVDYFSRFIWAFPCTTADQYKVIRCISWLISYYRAPVAFYTDEGSHFARQKIRDFLNTNGIKWIPAPIRAKKATSIVEMCNNLFEKVAKKAQENPDNWPFDVQLSAFKVNRKEIEYLGFSLFEVLKGY